MPDITDLSSPRFGRFPKAQERTGLSRGTIYNLGKRHKGLLRKAGKCTLIDLLLLDEIVAALPDADLGTAQEA